MERLKTLFDGFFPKKLRTFQTIVVDKKTTSGAMLIGGGTLWVPSTIHFLVLENGGHVKVDMKTFNTIQIGDAVWVSEYSNGSYRLHYS